MDIPSPTSSIMTSSASHAADTMATQPATHASSVGKVSPVRRNVPLKFSHFASLESSEVLQAATKDIVGILQLKVGEGEVV